MSAKTEVRPARHLEVSIRSSLPRILVYSSSDNSESLTACHPLCAAAYLPRGQSTCFADLLSVSVLARLFVAKRYPPLCHIPFVASKALPCHTFSLSLLQILWFQRQSPSFVPCESRAVLNAGYAGCHGVQKDMSTFTWLASLSGI